ncbi:MAG TPA: hypothetical protein VMW27_25665 [Thermoanaerobaculia bacterium]|nr:hypothetical protein [Thermoanaerobaculia bacterium]
MRKPLCLMILLAALLAVPALAADRIIYNGIDLWRTTSDGSTFADFVEDPIPAGFFCNKSEPFAGRIPFKGVPVATSVPGVLGATDTIVQRLDDAVFNRHGVATTRIQLRSLNFESLAPLKTACGDFVVKLALDGEQPITQMRIFRENAKGGRFLAPIAVNIKIFFTPVGRPDAERLEIRREVRFPPLPNQRWRSLGTQNNTKVLGFVLADTDGDRVPDTYVPGTSNFGVGLMRTDKGGGSECQFSPENPNIDCHGSSDGGHCVC